MLREPPPWNPGSAFSVPRRDPSAGVAPVVPLTAALPSQRRESIHPRGEASREGKTRRAWGVGSEGIEDLVVQEPDVLVECGLHFGEGPLGWQEVTRSQVELGRQVVARGR